MENQVLVADEESTLPITELMEGDPIIPKILPSRENKPKWIRKPRAALPSSIHQASFGGTGRSDHKRRQSMEDEMETDENLGSSDKRLRIVSESSESLFSVAGVGVDQPREQQ